MDPWRRKSSAISAACLLFSTQSCQGNALLPGVSPHRQPLERPAPPWLWAYNIECCVYGFVWQAAKLYVISLGGSARLQTAVINRAK
ncbi:hypothetical protein V8C26DRAFT_404035 [Trichoderma gracile]